MDGDEVIVMQTPDIEEGDLVCIDYPAWYGGEPDGAYNLGVLRIQSPTLYFETPGEGDTPGASTGNDLAEVNFIGRAVAVHRAGKPVDVPFEFRPYIGDATRAQHNKIASEGRSVSAGRLVSREAGQLSPFRSPLHIFPFFQV